MKMRIWKAPSGRLHLRNTCSGTTRQRGSFVWLTKEQMKDAQTNQMLCRCLTWRGEIQFRESK